MPSTGTKKAGRGPKRGQDVRNVEATKAEKEIQKSEKISKKKKKKKKKGKETKETADQKRPRGARKRSHRITLLFTNTTRDYKKTKRLRKGEELKHP